MGRLKRDGTAEPVQRDLIRRERGERNNVHFPCSVDHEQEWRRYHVDAYSAIICDDLHTYIPTLSGFKTLVFSPRH